MLWANSTIQRPQSIRKITNFWYTFGWKWWVISFRDYLGLLDASSYDVDDVIGRADRFGFQNFCSPAMTDLVHVWHDDRYWSKILCSTFMLKFYVKVFRTSLFLNSAVYLFHVWHDDRCWSQILCSTIPKPLYDFKVKVTDLEFLYCNFFAISVFP